MIILLIKNNKFLLKPLNNIIIIFTFKKILTIIFKMPVNKNNNNNTKTVKLNMPNENFTNEQKAYLNLKANFNKTKKFIRKAGRTLLIKSTNGSSIDNNLFDSMDGLLNKVETKNSNSYFLTFDTVANALKTFHKIKAESDKYYVKFSYYKVFFTIDGLNDTIDYNQVKQELTDFVNQQSPSSVLYCKFYRKGNKYLGYGDLTVDTVDVMNSLISKTNGNKEFTFGSYKGSFYRFNIKKPKTSDNIEAN